MPQQLNTSVTNGLSKGLLTEFTGLNYPEDAVIDTFNCVFERIGNVHRRPAIDFEDNYTTSVNLLPSAAYSTFVWTNAGGDGNTKLYVVQRGVILTFYKITSATISSPLSTQLQISSVNLSSFVPSGFNFDVDLECQYASGNGYLFVFHPSCDPFYVTYTGSDIGTVTRIPVQIRDLTGIYEINIADNFRPSTLTPTHNYNIFNQGWSSSPSWATTSTTSNNTNTGLHTWTVNTGLPIVNGTLVNVSGFPSFPFVPTSVESGTVTAYNPGTGTLTLNITASSFPAVTSNNWSFSSVNTGYLDVWIAAVGNVPSNSDVWWRFKNAAGVFSPSTTVGNITLDTGPASKGHFIIEAFNQQRSIVAGLPPDSTNIPNVTTSKRPRTGTWFQGRVWYTGVDASNTDSSGRNSTWTESIYFSQIIENPAQFGRCYQSNDPTSEDDFDLLPTDGGVIVIQGSGSIYKLFPIQNGLLVFAANGVWFITGSSGIGFAANDYNITKISNIQSVSGTSFVDVRGLPMWWNDEGIYTISIGQDQNGPQYGAARGAAGSNSLNVESVSFTTIQTFYDEIPLLSKRSARGAYDPLNWTVRWIYKSTQPAFGGDKYKFDSALTFNTATNAFYPWITDTTNQFTPTVAGIEYVQSPGGSNAPDPSFKYLTSFVPGGVTVNTFSDENNDEFLDWLQASAASPPGGPVDFTSYFVTGFRVHNQALRKFQSNYVRLFINNDPDAAYKFQGLWDYAINRNSNKFTSLETVSNFFESPSNFSAVTRRHRVRGRGVVQQFKLSSVSGKPFDVFGWAVDERLNQSV